MKRILHILFENYCSVQSTRFYGYSRGPWRAAVHRLKYHQDMGIAEELSVLLIQRYSDEFKWQIDVITSIPTSRERYIERGYNLAYLFAKPFAWAIYNRELRYWFNPREIRHPG
jgi:predicted amidophosphoribosyltransferase